MDVQNLIMMANDIARYFATDPDHETGVEGVADHLRKFWTPRMCKQIVEHLESGGDGLDELTRIGVERLAASQVGG